jgi:kanamycin kinase
MLAGKPSRPIALPPRVAAIAAGRQVRVVWENELGGLAFEIGAGAQRCFVKWAPAQCAVDPDRERVRLDWAGAFTCVPRVLGQGADGEGSWLITSALPGENAVAERWSRDPARAVAAIGSGLRAFHEALPVAGCPFSWSAEERLADVRRRAAQGRIHPERWDADHRDLDLEQAVSLVERIPPTDRPVVCHGDSCAPNTLIGDDGRCAGHVDLGALGVADRWADLAIATWSTRWNYGPGWEDALLAAYGIAPDEERTRYYRLLWDLGP